MKSVARRLLGVFATPQEAVAAVTALRHHERCGDVEVYSPVPDHDLLEAAPPRPKPVRYFSMTGAVLGLVSGFALALWTSWLFKQYMNGMEWFAPVPFVIIGFEATVLAGGLFTLLGLMVGCRLPRFWAPALWDARLSEDHFGVGVDCAAEHVEELARLLVEHGAADVHRA
jgi:molybdopterin-containing oxidoreductase family membrane subunit